LNLLYFGNFGKNKGIHTIIEAMGIIKGRVKAGQSSMPRLELRGNYDDPAALAYYRYLTGLIRTYDLGDCIKVDGFINDTELADKVSAADAVLLPYLGTHGTSASGPFQWAMSCCVPVIASATPVFKELVSEGCNGWLFPIGDAMGLAAVIEKLAAAQDLLVAATTSIPGTREGAHWRAIAQSFTALFKE
jgi:glycosyltransferase involved in cell wall biosynthesis